ncbi:DUF6384 family protein [Lacipirellula parvula]|uniref:Uncharacterized protein n=1 Tax=Lacipirellula parvula TaxID=2650471 RepID=A0A5K7XLX8_9BACT|nr:DUF6384 family protein [Lacipirellula parvula]BBO33969.1 hypothetical protein PLANPX_3581 [Lacipirellula parvula]
MSNSQATQAAEAPSQSTIDSDGLPAGERLSLAEMTRIMDVAATLRKERTLVEQQLNIDEIKAALRDRLLEAAKLNGDPVTPAEIDAAVEQYYDRLHEFRDPPASFSKFLAHCWVLRKYLTAAVVALAGAAALVWGLVFTGVLPGEARTRYVTEQQQADLDAQLSESQRLASAISKLSTDPAATAEAERLSTMAVAAHEQRDGKKIAAATKELQELQALLELEYGLFIVNAPGEQSATERLWTDDEGTRTSGYFVFVDALDEQNQPVSVPIRNRETDRVEMVSRWGEQVPKKVFDRLYRDKQKDGVLDEREFGRKQRGTREVEVQLRGADDEPIERRGQITSWK